MSFYKFIACEYELPGLYNSRLYKPDDTETNMIKYEDNLNDLEVIPGMVFYDIPYYTKLSNIYDLSFTYAEEGCQLLYNYLVSNCKQYKKCEIWSIWLANCASKNAFRDGIKKELKNLKVTSLPLSELTVDILKEVLCSGETPRKLTLY